MKKIWIICTSLLLSLVLCFGIVGCNTKKPEKATISVSVNGTAQTNGGSLNATVNTDYTVAATASNDEAVSASYKFGSASTEFTGSTFTPKEEGEYVFTFTADRADAFKLTFNVTRQNTSAQYTVTFALGTHSASDANDVPARTVVAGTVITLPSAPKAESGYTFGGWSDGAKTFEEGASYTVNSKVTLTAVWNTEKFTVSYSVGDHAAQSATAPAAQSVNINANIQLPDPIPAASGYIFTGWSNGSATREAGETYTVTGNVTFTAMFEETSAVSQVTVKFALGNHAASGATVPAQQTVSVGDTITLPSAIAAESGWLFDGWSVGAAGAAYTVNAPVTITAQWKVDPATPVRGIVNGGFETGDLTGWTVASGSADSVSVTNRTVFWEADVNFMDMNGETVQKYLQEGEYFLVTDEETEAALKSAAFVLGGDGIITFKFGIAKNPVCYVALCDAATNEELVKITNDCFNDPTLAQVLLRRVMYANDYIGRNVYIKIVDGATADFGFLNFDDLKVSLTIEEAEQIIDADKNWAATYRQDVINSNVTMGAQTKNIINAIRDYYAALTVKNIKTVYITKSITDKAVLSGTKNITEYLSEAKGSMLGVSSDTLVKSIVSISDGTTTTTSGFETFALNSGKSYTVTYRITDPASSKYVEETFTITVSSNNEIINGGFETGDLTGWTVTGNGFVGVESATTCWNGSYNQEGNYHLDGWKGADSENGQGTLRSSTFTLGGTGKISFRLGGGNFKDGTYVSVKKANGTEIARFTNTKQQPKDSEGRGEQYMWLYVYDLTAVADLGDELYIEIVDCQNNGPDDGVWRLLFVDDIKTYHTAESFAALGAKGADYFEATNQLNAD